MKSIGLMARQSGTTRAAFRAYYEEHHAPLACRHFAFRKYVRNHVIWSDPADIDFDVLSEFWMDDAGTAASAYVGEVATIMAEDEARFMDSSMTRPMVVEECVVSGSARGEDCSGARRAIFMVRDTRADAGGDRLLSLARGLAGAPGASRVSADRVIEGLFGAAAPADGFISVWLSGGAPAPQCACERAGFALVTALLAEIEETAGEAMAAAYRAR